MDLLFENLLLKAINKKITDLHFISKNHPTIKMRYRNEICDFATLSPSEYEKLFNYIMYLANINFNNLNQPQTGQFSFALENSIYYFRLSYLPSNHDAHLVLRILNNHQKIELEQLSKKSEVLSFFSHILEKEDGLIIVCGPTGSGKSTTLHAFIDYFIKTFHKNIITIEDPGEIYHQGIIQLQVGMDLSYENILEQILRHDPDIIMIGEIRNEKTAAIAIKLALTGHLVLTTIHAGSVANCILRLINLNIAKIDLLDTLLAVISQRLIYPKNQDAQVLFEYASHDQLKSLINDHQIIYKTMQDSILDDVKKGLLLYEDIKQFLKD